MGARAAHCCASTARAAGASQITLERRFRHRLLGVLGCPGPIGARAVPDRDRGPDVGDLCGDYSRVERCGQHGQDEAAGDSGTLYRPRRGAGRPLEAHDSRWAAIKKNGMGASWFETEPVDEVADILAASCLQRSRQPGGEAGLKLMHRGIPMLEAAATAAVCEGLPPLSRPSDRARTFLAPYTQYLLAAEMGEHVIVLLQHGDSAVGAARALLHKKSVTPPTPYIKGTSC